MVEPLSKTYDAAAVEAEQARRWQAADAFHAEPGDGGDPYAIVIPPPNVTAALHLGHALNNTLQDVLVRWRRMCGDNAVWLPGTDHAGIATQTVVDKRLQAEGERSLKDYKKQEAEGKGGREQFVAKVQAWKDEYEQRITEQLKAMGCSCDWQRQAFTMDQVRARAVGEAFFRLFSDGLIYRGKRLVNWDPATQTALADDEVEMEEIDGHFWYMRYPLGKPGDEAQCRGASSPGSHAEYVTVATTRPETMLGDTAVAVNPNDPDRAHLIGRHVRLPIVNRVIPIIGDEYVVMPDPESSDEKAKYASGFLKVTPAHDPNDYEIGQRHHLPMINVMAPDGTISRDHGWPEDEWDMSGEPKPSDNPGHDDFLENLLGMDRYEAREAIVEWFRRNDLLEAVQPYRHTVGHSYRSHVPIEPYLSDQWYVKVTDERLAGAALRAMAEDQRSEGECVWSEEHPFAMSRERKLEVHQADRELPLAAHQEGQLRFTPDRYARTFQTWHENIRDWCISRQLWWGHRIPVWHKRVVLSEENWIDEVAGKAGLDSIIEQNHDACVVFQRTCDGQVVNPSTDLMPVVPATEGEYDIYVCCDEVSGRGLEDYGFTQDPDVLDTWFSSALWPLSTLGWPDETDELKTWNPTSTLSTAREIITLWVSRMVMFNCYFRGRVPFRDVFIHAMIQDGEGRKMSKSLGNGVDPLDIIHSHGADAMRFTLTLMTTQTQDVRMPVELDPDTGRNTSPKFDIGRNFANKLWNAGRFALGNLKPGERPTHGEGWALGDRWIQSRLARTVRNVDEALRGFQFNAYAQTVYDFFWRDLCDWYLEAIKPVVRGDDEAGGAARATLAACLDAVVRLLHPVMPFVTEAMFEQLNAIAADRGMAGVALPPSDLCIRAGWPKVDQKLIDTDAERRFDLLREVVSAIREARSTYKVPPRDKVNCSAKAPADQAEALDDLRGLLETLATIDLGEVGPDVAKPSDAAATVVGDMEIYLDGLVDADAERQRLTKRLDELAKSRQALRGRLSNTGYVDKAPAHLVQQTRDQLADVEREMATVRENLESLET